MYYIGIFTLALRSSRRRLSHISFTRELLQNVRLDRIEYIQYARDSIPHAQTEGLQVFAREQLGYKSHLYVQYVPDSVSNGTSKKTLRMCPILLQAA